MVCWTIDVKDKKIRNTEVKSMQEKLKKEIEIGAKIVEMSVEEAMDKFKEICKENTTSEDSQIALALWRGYVGNVQRMKKVSNNSSNTGSNSLVKKAFGFFVALEAPRDMMSWNRNRAKEEYLRDADRALEDGHVAVATQNDDNTWTVARYHNNEYEEKRVSSLPDGAEETEDGSTIIPLDNQPTYMSGAKNRNYGKPLPLEQFRRTGIFYGSLEGGEMKTYMFSYKNQPAVDFSPNCYEWIHFLCIPSDDGSAIYGMTETTLKSLMLNTDVDPEGDDYRDMSSFDFESCLASNFKSHLVPLPDVDRAHIERQTLPARERFIITDGSVDSITMTATANGNRIINISDLSAEFVEDGENYTTCWIPSHIDIDFGIASSVIVVGRTSQRIVDGVADAVTINVSGLMVTNRVGAPPETVEIVEDDLDWF